MFCNRARKNKQEGVGKTGGEICLTIWLISGKESVIVVKWCLRSVFYSLNKNFALACFEQVYKMRIANAQGLNMICC